MNKKQITILIVTTFSSLLTPFMGSAINVALPSIGSYFNSDIMTLNWVATGFLLSSSIFLLPAGRLADIYSLKLIFTIGISIFGIFSIASALSWNITSLIVFRVVQGIGGAMIFSTGVALLISFFPIQQRGRVLGINVASVYVGLSLGPTLGGVLVKQFDWQSVFWLTVPFAAVVLILTNIVIREDIHESSKQRFDYKGMFVYTFFLTSLIYGFSKLPQTIGFVLTSAGIVLGVFFYLIEQKQAYPLLNVLLLKQNKVFRYSNLAAFINYASTFAVGFLLSYYLQYIKGYNPQESGMILLSQPILMALLSPLSGRLSDKIEPRILATTGMTLSTIGLFLLSFLSIDSSITFIIVSLIIIGVGFSLFSSPNTNAVMSSVNKNQFGIASATLGTMRITGQMFSMGIAMLFFSLIMGKQIISPAHFQAMLKSLNTTFLFFSIMGIVGIASSYIRGNVRDK